MHSTTKVSPLLQPANLIHAIEAFDHVIQSTPGSVPGWLHRGMVLYDLGRYNDAIESYGKTLDIDPANADAWYLKGRAIQALNNIRRCS